MGGKKERNKGEKKRKGERGEKRFAPPPCYRRWRANNNSNGESGKGNNDINKYCKFKTNMELTAMYATRRAMNQCNGQLYIRVLFLTLV